MISRHAWASRTMGQLGRVLSLAVAAAWLFIAVPGSGCGSQASGGAGGRAVASGGQAGASTLSGGQSGASSASKGGAGAGGQGGVSSTGNGGAGNAGGGQGEGGSPSTGGRAGAGGAGGGDVGTGASGGSSTRSDGGPAQGGAGGGPAPDAAVDAPGASGGADGAIRADVIGGVGGGRDGGGTGGRPGTGGTGEVPSLWQTYADYFPIGAAVDTTNYTSSTLTKHFNSITTEDQMKFDALEPSEGQFSYTTADKMVDFAATHSIRVRGHTLVWHRQNPSWVFANATRDVLLKRMKNHISNVMKHFKGKVYAWDVVNEAFMDDGKYRTGNEAKDDQKSQWYAILGESYVAEAFKAAYEADPTAKLFYNDYYDYLPAKSDAIYTMLKGLLDSGVKVHGVGMQCHLNIAPSTDSANQAYYQTVANLEAAIKKYASLGIEVQVTELDLSLYIPGVTYTSADYYTSATFTSALQTKQADRYAEFFDLFRSYKDVITGVTLWGISDDNTWLSEFSSGRKDFPLLFDANQKPKPAFWSVVSF